MSTMPLSGLEYLRENLFAYYPLAGDAKDYGPKGYDGTTNDEVKFSPGGDWGKVADFTTGGACISLNPMNKPEHRFADRYTICAWVKLEGYDNIDIPTLTTQGGLQDHKIFGSFRIRHGDGQLSYLFQYHPRNRFLINLKSKLSIKVWHHLLVTYDQSSGIIAFYIDGVLDTEEELFNQGVPKTAQPIFGGTLLTIGGSQGASNYGYTLNGYIGDLYVFKTNVSQKDVDYLALKKVTEVTEESKKRLVGTVVYLAATLLATYLILKPSPLPVDEATPTSSYKVVDNLHPVEAIRNDPNISSIQNIELTIPISGEKTATFTVPNNADAFLLQFYFDGESKDSIKKVHFKLIEPLAVPDAGLAPLYYNFTSAHNAIILSNDSSFAPERGYGSLLVPMNSTQANNIHSEWKVKFAYDKNVVTPIAKVSLRVTPNGRRPRTNGKDRKLFIKPNILTNDESDISLVIDALKHLKDTIYSQANIEVVILEQKRHNDVGNSLTDNIFSSQFNEIVIPNLQSDVLNLFCCQQITLNTNNPERGFSNIAGPVGFINEHSAVVVSLSGNLLDKTSLARRIGHEIGHYLGLTHESACQGLNLAPSRCSALLKDRTLDSDNPTVKKLHNNLMYTSRPGSELNSTQIDIIRAHPLVHVWLKSDKDEL